MSIKYYSNRILSGSFGHKNDVCLQKMKFSCLIRYLTRKNNIFFLDYRYEHTFSYCSASPYLHKQKLEVKNVGGEFLNENKHSCIFS